MNSILYKISRFYHRKLFPEIDKNSTEKYLEFFKIVGEKTADMIVEWIRVGFTHGVMNTDNMSIIGNTIDYSTFSFLDEYNLNFTSIQPIYLEEDTLLVNKRTLLIGI